MNDLNAIRRAQVRAAEDVVVASLPPELRIDSAAPAAQQSPDNVNHPAHYGGADNHYEAIKVIEAWGLGFCLGNTVKYISRAGKKGARLEDLKKAAWYLAREIENQEKTHG
jgi:hypothetical protein